MATLANFHVEQNTVQTRTGATTYAAVTDTTIDGSSLSANTKYLVVARMLLKGDSSGRRYGVRVATADDADVATYSECVYEPQRIGADDFISLMWAGSFTTDASPADILFEFASTQNAANTVSVDQLTLWLLDLDAVGTEGTDYHEYVRKTNSSAYGDNDTAESPVAIGNLAAADLGTDEWLIFGAVQTTIATSGKWHQITVEAAPNQASLEDVIFDKGDGEDTAELRMTGFGIIHHDTSTASDVTMYGLKETGATGQVSTYGYMCALPTSIFSEVPQWTYTAAATSSFNTETTVQSEVASAPDPSGNHLVIGHATADLAASWMAAYMHVEEGTTEIRTGDSAVSLNQQWNVSYDEKGMSTFQRYSISGAATFNLRGNNDSTGRTFSKRWLILVNLEAASAAAAPPTFPRPQLTTVRM